MTHQDDRQLFNCYYTKSNHPIALNLFICQAKSFMQILSQKLKFKTLVEQFIESISIK